MIARASHAEGIRSGDERPEPSRAPRPVTEPVLVTWLDRHGGQMDKYWSRLRNSANSFLATFLIFLLGICYRGEWMLIYVHFTMRSRDGGEAAAAAVAGAAESNNAVDNSASLSISRNWENLLPESPYLRHFVIMWIATSIVAFTIYTSVCGFLHWYFYVNQRDNAEEWKCQPYRWLSYDMEKREIMLGVFSLFCVNIVTAVFASYLLNGGPSMIYYGFDDYTWYWWFLQWPVTFVILDYETYWFHRLYHYPTMYKWFHKLHHSWKQPTAWSATAIHPIEIMHMQLVYIVSLFIIPTHLIPYCTIMMYNFYHGILDHSGINFKAQWWQPWQPPASFHDNHHQYTHVNFGFNMFLWDKLHGTYRMKDRVYNEDIFFGKGKVIVEATKEELEADLNERILEHVDTKQIYNLADETNASILRKES